MDFESSCNELGISRMLMVKMDGIWEIKAHVEDAEFCTKAASLQRGLEVLVGMVKSWRGDHGK